MSQLKFLFPGEQNEEANEVTRKLVVPNSYRIPPKWQRTDYYKKNIGHVYSVVNLIADATAGIKLQLKQGNPEDYKIIDSHPFLDLVYNPGEMFDKYSWIYLYIIYKELTGEDFLYLAPDRRGVPTCIFPLLPHRMNLIPADKGSDLLIKGYEYASLHGDIIRLSPAEVAYDRNPDPEYPLRGMSTMSAAQVPIDSDIFAAQYNRDFFYNSAIPKGAFVVDGSLSNTQYERMREEINARHGSLKKSHKPALLEGGLKWQEVGMKQKDMDFLNLRKYSRDEILSIWRVPKAMLTTDDVNRATALTAERIFYKLVVKPRMDSLVRFLSSRILPLYGDRRLFLDFENPVPQDQEIVNAKIKTGYETMTMTLNERRIAMGLEPLDDPAADEIPQPILGPEGSVTINMIKAARPADKGNTASHIYYDSRVKSFDVAMSEAKSILTEAVQKTIKSEEPEYITFTEHQKSVIWKSFDNEVSDYTSLFEWHFRRVAKAQEKRVLEKLGVAVERSAKDFEKKELGDEEALELAETRFNGILNVPAEGVAFVAAMQPIIERMLLAAANNTLAFVGSDQVFDLENPRIRRYLTNGAIEWIEEINTYTKRQLIKRLAEGLKNGESIPQLVSRVKEVYQDIADYRAERIARTSGGGAVSLARLEAFRQSGVVEFKEWLSSRDGKVRDSHVAADGERVKTNKNFSTGCSAPRLCSSLNESVNCRCDILPILKKETKFVLPNYRRLIGDNLDDYEKQLQFKRLDTKLEELYTTHKLIVFSE